MPSYKRPGVYAEEVLSPTSAILQPNVGVAAFVAAFGRGPTTPTLVESWSQYTALFGGFGLATQYLPFTLHQFFSNGGRQAWVTRVLGTGAVKATRTLLDRAGTPVATLRVDALNEGAWGNNIFIDITDSGTTRFNLIVKYGGTTDAFVVERWTDLSMVDNDARYAPSIINSPTAGSTYISVTDLVSATVAPTDRPSVQAGTTMAAGADGAAPTPTQMSTAVALLDQVNGPLTINLPGVIDTTVLTATMSYVDARGDAFLVVDTDQNLTAAQAVSYAATFTSSNAAVYYPWLYVGDPSSNSPGAIKKIPPGGGVVGQYARVETLRGIHKAPAGVDTRLAGVVAVETKLTSTDLDTLNPGNVNAIRQLPGVGIAIFGARTTNNTSTDRYVSVRRTLNYIRKSLLDGTQWAVFEPNDSTLWGGLRQRIERFLLQMWQRGALRGASAKEAFYVKCDADNNPPASIAAGQVNIEVGVALQFPAEFVVIRIGQWEGGGTATVAA